MIKTKQPELCNLSIRQFDEDHQQLMQMINILYLESSDKSQDRVAQKLIISILTQFARKHFDNEEEFMQRIKFPDLDKHQQCHRIIYAQLRDLEQRLQTSNSGPIATHGFQFLLNWLNVHTLTEDKWYAEHALNCA